MTINPVTDGASQLKDELVDVATMALPYAAVLAGITLGWRWVRSFLGGGGVSSSGFGERDRGDYWESRDGSSGHGPGGPG